MRARAVLPKLVWQQFQVLINSRDSCQVLCCYPNVIFSVLHVRGLADAGETVALRFIIVAIANIFSWFYANSNSPVYSP